MNYLEKEVNAPDRFITSITCNDITFGVEDSLHTGIVQNLRLELLKDDSIKTANYTDSTSETVTTEEAFHITSMIIQQNKKRDYIKDQTIRLAEHNMNKHINKSNDIAKRRNKRKLNKKFNK